MTQQPAKINEVIMYRGGESFPFPVLNDSDARGFVADMIAEGFTDIWEGSTVHLFAPVPVAPEPLPKVVTRGLNAAKRLFSGGPNKSQPGPNSTATRTNSEATGSNVVSLAAYRNRQQSQRDYLVIDGGTI